MAPAKIALCGIPFDEHSSYLRGAAKAPPLLRNALASDASNQWTETGFDLGDPELLQDTGDIDFDADADPHRLIERRTADLLDAGQKPLFLGGDHAITYPVLRAFANKYPQLSILHFDAHPDLYDEFRGDRLSHACPFARIMEEGLTRRLVQVGIRTLNEHQRKQAEKFGVEQITMSRWQEGIVLTFDTPLYISFDLDVLEPGFAPGISHWEPGGLSPRQAIQMLHALHGEVVGADLVEYNPDRDLQGMSAVVAAKIVKELAGLLLKV
jgi:agmatinase